MAKIAKLLLYHNFFEMATSNLFSGNLSTNDPQRVSYQFNDIRQDNNVLGI